MTSTSDILNLQKIRLDKLQAINSSKKPILIKAIEGKAPDGVTEKERRLYQWNFYSDVWSELTQPIYTRGILPNEICFDPDLKDWNRLKTELQKIQTYCIKDCIPLELGYSGGNGIHVHIFFGNFKIDIDNFDNCKKYDIDLFKIVRNVLLDIILDGAGTNKLALALDTKKINFGQDRKGSQIREYGTLRPNGSYKTFITTIPDKKPEHKELPLVFPETVGLWVIPEKHNKKINDKIRQEIKKAIEYNNFNTEFIDLRGNRLEKFPCLKTLFKNGSTTGSRYYGSNSITLMGKQCGLSWTATVEHIKKLFEKCEITESEAKLRIDHNKPLFESADYHFSCRTMKEVFGEDICNFFRCPLCKHPEKIHQADAGKEDEIPQYIKDRANQILDEGKAIEFLMRTYQKMHVGDETTGKATLGAIGSQSVKNSNGIQPKVSGNSGMGKSHAEATIIHLVPSEYVKETSLSGKAAFHANIPPGTIIFSDDADIDDTIQGVIKRSTTNFQKKTNHEISIRDGNEWTTKILTIPERVLWVLTSVADNGSIEFLNRQFNLGVDETTNQDNAVWEFLQKKAKNGETDFPINDDVLICREIIRDIKKHLFTVKIPYSERIEFYNKENRRNGAQFLDFIKSFAVFNYRLRAKIEESTIEANEDDFREALTLYGQRAPNQRLKLNDNEIAILKNMVVNEPYTIEKLQDINKRPYQYIYRMFHGRDGRTGLLEKVPGLTYKPETEFIGDIEIVNEYGSERTITKKTKPKHVYVLTVDFNSLLNFGTVAALKPEVRS